MFPHVVWIANFNNVLCLTQRGWKMALTKQNDRLIRHAPESASQFRTEKHADKRIDEPFYQDAEDNIPIGIEKPVKQYRELEIDIDSNRITESEHDCPRQYIPSAYE